MDEYLQDSPFLKGEKPNGTPDTKILLAEKVKRWAP
jgi:hypothetical protein